VEFHEKLQALRKNRGLTQEELAEALYVSRTAVSKWESGRGYPSIDSLKEISSYFSVTIDELLTGEKLITLAEKENKANVQNICDLLLALTDLLSCLMLLLPLYPYTVDGYIYSVNLFAYREIALLNRVVYWAVFLALVFTGVLKLLLTCLRKGKMQKTITAFSMALSIAAVIILALSGETYAIIVVFLLLIMKAALLYKSIKVSRP